MEFVFGFICGWLYRRYFVAPIEVKHRLIVGRTSSRGYLYLTVAISSAPSSDQIPNRNDNITLRTTETVERRPRPLQYVSKAGMIMVATVVAGEINTKQTRAREERNGDRQRKKYESATSMMSNNYWYVLKYVCLCKNQIIISI